MEHIVGWTILGLVLISCEARTTFAQNSTVSSKELCLRGNIYNNNLTLTGSNGTLRSPREDLSYHPDMVCNWLITVPEGNIVKLTFDKIDLKNSFACHMEYVEVFDGKNSYSESKGKFCGSKHRPSFREHVRSSSRYMFVRFRSDWYFDEYSRGFEATFTAENETICPYNALVVSASASYEKTLTSPNYPSHPDNDRNCNWLLEVDNGLPSDGYIVKVTFSDFSLEYYDKLNLYDGNTPWSKRLGSYCGSTPPDVIYSTGRYLYVNFRTDDFKTSKGFNLSFSAVKEEEASAICRPWDSSDKVHSLSGTSGTFFSPDFPCDYPDDVQCIWIVSVPAGKVVKLTFKKFQLELDPEDCKLSDYKDYVQIRDGQVPNGKELAVYCGYYGIMGPSDVYSTGNYMSVMFQAISDGKQSSRGFKALFEAVDPQSAISNHSCFSGNVNNNNLKITASHGTLQSPLRGSFYPPDLSCDWIITVPEGKIVKLSFDIFDFQPGSWWKCTADHVEILDGKYNNSESKGKFCAFRPEDIRSSGRYMRVRFRSDSETSYYAYSGFNASFIAEDKPTEHVVRAPSMEVCFPGNINNNNLKLIGSHGTLQSPQQDYTYPADSSCDWLVAVPDGKIVKLSFETFDLERSIGSSCTADYVEVLDGSNIDSVSKGRFCGSTAPSDITSSGRYMWVAFRSDSQHSNYLGFKATFTAEDKSSFGTVIIIIVVSLAVLVLLAFCVVCVIKRKKKPDSDADLGIPMTTATNSASHTTRPGEVQHSRLSSPQVPEPTELVLNIHPLPPVGYAPVPTNPEVPPPAYPHPLESPPPYPGEEAAPQYPPPGEPYPWQQTRSSAPVEPSAPTEGLVEPSAPPVSP